MEDFCSSYHRVVGDNLSYCMNGRKEGLEDEFGCLLNFLGGCELPMTCKYFNQVMNVSHKYRWHEHAGAGVPQVA